MRSPGVDQRGFFIFHPTCFLYNKPLIKNNNIAMIPTILPLFDWDAVDARSDLDRLFLVRDNLPDQPLISALETQRGQGRDDSYFV